MINSGFRANKVSLPRSMKWRLPQWPSLCHKSKTMSACTYMKHLSTKPNIRQSQSCISALDSLPFPKIRTRKPYKEIPRLLANHILIPHCLF